ncbi:MAG TPA: bifunctional riboflavin kinase/FAD synthetase [Mycobacteriales bacterium]|nr:bifunctional riboflavin kinase/FAD synthetase [Mycobacteriales bacterium]
MHRWRGLDAVPTGWGRCVVTIGVFDGVHRGHQRIIGRAVERATHLGLPAVVVTFDPHPSEVVRPGSHPAILTSPAHQGELISGLGVDVLCLLPFTVEFSRLTPAEFAHAILVEHLHAQEVVVGRNFRFGHKAAGDVAELSALGSRFGFRSEGVDLLDDAGTTISSTYVRACVAAGDVSAAARALGREHRVEGTVVRGDRRGRTLGYPTANVEVAAHTAVPADGVYAGWLVRGPKPGVGADRVPAAISVGTNPTFAGQERRVEAFVLDFDADIYGEHVGVDFSARLRPTVAFASVEDLVAQMVDDVRRTRALLS